MDQVDRRLWREFNRGREMAHFKRQLTAAMKSNDNDNGNDNDNSSTPVDLDEYKLAQLERDSYGVMNPEHIGHDANFNIPSALPPADTDASEFVEYGSANDDTGSRETPIVVDDDAASAASSETLRADSPSPSPYSDSDDAGDAHRSDELSQLGVGDLDDEVDDDDIGDDENIYSDDSDGDSNAVDNMLRENGETYGCDTDSLIGDINGDSEADSLSNEASYLLHEKVKTLVEQFDRVSETMYIVETNLVALEDHLQRGASLHDISYLLESFIRLRDMVGEMDSKVSHLGDEAVHLSVNPHVGDIAAEKVNDGLRNMVFMGWRLGARHRIQNLECGIRDLVEQQLTPAADLRNARGEQHGTYPQPPFRAGTSIDARNSLATISTADAEIRYSPHNPDYLPSTGPSNNCPLPPAPFVSSEDLCEPSVLRSYQAGNSSGSNAHSQRHQSPYDRRHQTPSGRSQLHGNQTREGSVHAGQSRGNPYPSTPRRRPYHLVHPGSMRQLRPALIHPQPQVLAARGQMCDVSSTSLYPENSR
ncbi:hypothetical protein D6C90_06635 [Aureobasidium pullulans]|uniref:Uncharacterized protein n=1 Tax=Aureobasidium pullulans TaxID=5580 RepID=A0A4S9UGQ2_AURPU|nr:hypothetical protein D6D04_10532 [Aureobasidium pullulans]THZ37670.1 hypothetical protein D6C90_06635 [Aureobasidium pullulans]